MITVDRREPVQQSELVDAQNHDASHIASVTTEDVCIFPASLEQHRYWALDQIDRASTASNMAIAFRLIGEVKDTLAEESICALTLRHEALRTTFRMVNGDVNQVISDEALYHFSVSDLRSLPEAERPAQAEKLMREHSHVTMDLATGPLFFAHLIHLSDQEHFLACTMHHIVCDGWSNGLLVRDFAEFYSAYAQGRTPDLPELPFQFADFTIWQHDWLESDAARDALVFWKEQIQRGVPAVDLPTDRPRTSRKDGPGDIESQLLPRSIQERLKPFCRRRQATTHQVLLSAFQALLSRYTDQEEFLLGSSIANRTQPGMDNVVGRFANPQVILADVAGNPAFSELLDRVIQWSMAAYAYQDLPFSRLMEEFQMDQSGATSQFLQVYFVYQKAFMQPQDNGALKIVPRPSVSGGVNFDLLVSIVERAEGPRMQIEYNTDLFARERIQSFIQQYIRLVDAVLDDETLKVSELPLLSAEETLALEAAGKGAACHRAAPQSLIEAFDRQAAKLADAAAIVAGKERTTWKALTEKSLLFAGALQQLGIKREQTVALRMEPTADTAAAALAILRLGAVVIPVPATVSIDEWATALHQLKPQAALAHADFCHQAASKISSLTSFEQLARAGISPSDLPAPSGNDTAWSGISLAPSTDPSDDYRLHPVSHAVAGAGLTAAAQALRLQTGDLAIVLPAQTSTDAWIDLMLPLVNGVGIVWAANIAAKELQTLIDREQAGYAFATGSQWLELSSAGWRGDRRLQLVCRGDRLPAGLSNRLRHAGRLWSLVSVPIAGGPLGVAALADNKDTDWPIAPLPGQQLSVINHWGNAVPAGVIGELALNLNLGKNAEPIRTGLLAQHSPDHGFQGHGFQLVESIERSVRLYGYRMRLGELEDRLLAHPSVVQAKACVLHLANNKPTLVAYVAGANGTQLQAKTISEHLRATAPGHLADAEIVSVPAIPRRVDGSADIRVLPQPSETQSSLVDSSEYVPPRDEIETKLVAIWEDVFGIKGIGIRTSFFSLGGYSLMIVRLFARINKAIHSALPITTIFNAPTIEQIADILRGRQAYSSLVPVRTKGTKPPFFMILSYLLYGSLPDALGDDYPFYGLRELNGEEDMTPEERAASYVQTIRSIQREGPYYLGGWCAAGPLTIEVSRQLIESGQKVGLVVLFDAWHPGYAQKMIEEQKASPQVTLSAKLRRRLAFHRGKLRNQSALGKVKYFQSLGVNRLRTMRNKFYLKHWPLTVKIFKLIGQPLPDFMHNVTATTRRSFQQGTYQPFSVDLMLMRALMAPSFPGSDPECGWGEIVKGKIDVLWVPGDHETMFLEPNLSEVGKTLRGSLDQARENMLKPASSI